MRPFVHLILLVCLFSLAAADSKESRWKRKADLPTTLSDFVAVKDFETNYTYLVGGCESGRNIQAFPGAAGFVCTLSSKVWRYGYQSDTYLEVASASTGRYRHGAAIVKSHLFVFGGRDENGFFYPTMDILDLETKTCKYNEHYLR